MISQWGQRKVNTKCSFSFDEANIKSLYVCMKTMLSNAGGTQRMLMTARTFSFFFFSFLSSPHCRETADLKRVTMTISQ